MGNSIDSSSDEELAWLTCTWDNYSLHELNRCL